jgi:Flp pilus assembly protein TadB
LAASQAVAPGPARRYVPSTHSIMTTLTKNEILRLTPEQQADVAKLELRRAQKRERLLKQARQSRYFILPSGGGLALAYGAAVFSGAPFWLQMIIFVMAMAILIQAVGINRRVDALMELLNEDHDA